MKVNMLDKYNSETVTVLLKETTKKVEHVDDRLDTLSKKVDSKIDALDVKVDMKFNSLTGKFESYAGKVDELIGRLSDRVSLNESFHHENDKKIQYLDIVFQNKVKDLSEFQSTFMEKSKTWDSLDNKFHIKVTSEELLKKTAQEKSTKIKIYAAVISTILGIISFVIPFL